MSDQSVDSHHHYAFTRGYRAALQSKRLTDMPSSIRRDAELRAMFEQGWQKAQDELQAGHQFNKTGHIRHRVSWITMTALAGVATGFLIISFADRTNKTISPLSFLSEKPSVSEPVINQVQPSKHTATQTNSGYVNSTDTAINLSLLSDDERESLNAVSVKDAYPYIERQPIKHTNLIIKIELLNANDQTVYPENAAIPKSTRTVNLNLELKPNHSTITIRWLWDRKLIQQKTVNSGTKISLQQTLTGGWQGDWEIEILDDSGSVIYLYPFKYGHK